MQDDTKLIVSDGYLNEMAEYFEKQGKQLQGMANTYIAAMRNIAKDGTVEGRTANALKQFVEYAQRQTQAIASTSEQVSDAVMNYLEEFDTNDQYQY